MFYKHRRKAFYSQNFLHNPELVKKLVRQSSIGRNDLKQNQAFTVQDNIEKDLDMLEKNT